MDSGFGRRAELAPDCALGVGRAQTPDPLTVPQRVMHPLDDSEVL